MSQNDLSIARCRVAHEHQLVLPHQWRRRAGPGPDAPHRSCSSPARQNGSRTSTTRTGTLTSSPPRGRVSVKAVSPAPRGCRAGGGRGPGLDLPRGTPTKVPRATKVPGGRVLAYDDHVRPGRFAVDLRSHIRAGEAERLYRLVEGQTVEPGHRDSLVGCRGRRRGLRGKQFRMQQQHLVVLRDRAPHCPAPTKATEAAAAATRCWNACGRLRVIGRTHQLPRGERGARRHADATSRSAPAPVIPGCRLGLPGSDPVHHTQVAPHIGIEIDSAYEAGRFHHDARFQLSERI